MAHILFSEGSLRYFLLNFGQKLIQEYTEQPLDEEDLYVLESLLAWELGLLQKSSNRKLIREEEE